jgi:hypothetical protein
MSVMLLGSQISSAQSGAECDGRAWIRLPSDNMFSTTKPLDATHIRALSEGTRRIAIERLAATSISRVGPSELRELGIGEIPHGMQAFFVRGVAFNLSSGEWTLKLEQNMLYVRHDSLGNRMPSRCEPILVFLDDLPSEIFVGATLAK